MAEERRRQGELSDGEIIARIDAVKTELAGKIDGLSEDVHGIRREITTWRTEFVAQEVYKADERTRAEIRRQLEARDDEQGIAIGDLQAEAQRKDRERRKMWTALGVTIAGAACTAVFSLVIAIAVSHNSNQPSVVVCVPTATQPCN